MAEKTKKTVPALRFRGFTDEWQEKRLGEFATIVKRKNSELNTSRPLTISARYGLVDQTEFFTKVVASSNLSHYYLIYRGEFAYNRSYSSGYPWGVIKRLDLYDMGALSTLYTCFSVSGVSDEYLVHYFDTTRWHRGVELIAAEGARNHGLLNVPTEDLFETRHVIPSTLSEQEKIGELFSELDGLIRAKEEELEKLRQMKAALLEAMFPSAEDGTNVNSGGVIW